MNKTGIRIDFGTISSRGDRTSCLCYIILDENRLTKLGLLHYVHRACEYNKNHRIKDDIQNTKHTFYCVVNRNKNDKNDPEIAKKELLKKARKCAFKKVKRLYEKAAEYFKQDQQNLESLILNVNYNINKIILNERD